MSKWCLDQSGANSIQNEQNQDDKLKGDNTDIYTALEAAQNNYEAATERNLNERHMENSLKDNNPDSRIEKPSLFYGGPEYEKRESTTLGYYSSPLSTKYINTSTGVDGQEYSTQDTDGQGPYDIQTDLNTKYIAPVENVPNKDTKNSKPNLKFWIVDLLHR